MAERTSHLMGLSELQAIIGDGKSNSAIAAEVFKAYRALKTVKMVRTANLVDCYMPALSACNETFILERPFERTAITCIYIAPS